VTSTEPIRFVGPDHSYWTVYEVSDTHSQPWAGRSLIFVSDIGFRRVRAYPEGWRDMSPNELYDLSWQR
jgi:hypothetical protein